MIFLANAAHELRTPLAAIRSSVEVALSGDRNEEEYRELLAVVVDQCLALQTLVNQLLLLAETEADRLQTDFERIDLASLVSQAVDMFQGVSEDGGLKIVIDRMDNAIVAGNRYHLRQVMNNLLDNAIKFTTEALDASSGDPASEESRTSIHVELRSDPAEKSATLTIRDHGIGIASEDLPHIFERFYRVEPTRLREALFRTARHGDFGLLRDLHGLCLLAGEIGTTTEVLRHAAEELRDREFIAFCEHASQTAKRQQIWCTTQVQDNAAQSLVVPH